MMPPNQKIYHGILAADSGQACITTPAGKKLCEQAAIWEGYLAHWQNRQVCARLLPEQDYQSGLPIALLWPDMAPSPTPFFALYYNERLVMYPISFCGHIAINVNHEVFNFSQTLNENEVLTPEEYFYRPALGPFAPAKPTRSGKQRVNLEDKGKPYYDKFGRLFMRSIHVLQVESKQPGFEQLASALARFYHDKIRHIQSSPINPQKPDVYTGFSLFKESCTTIIRDGLRAAGYTGLRGILPRDLFQRAVVCFRREQEKGQLAVRFYKLPQLKVREAPYSKATPPLNPCNWFPRQQLSLH